MSFLGIVIIIALILAGLFFIGVLAWAVINLRSKKKVEMPRHIIREDSAGSAVYGTGSGEHVAEGRYLSSGEDADVQWDSYSSDPTRNPMDERFSDEPEVASGVKWAPSGPAAASDEEEMAEQSFYSIEDYDYTSEYLSDGKMPEGELDEAIQPKIVSANGKAPVIEKRERPQKRSLQESVRCNICLGFIKTGLPLLTCVCGKNYHISCASRIEECPICHRDMLEYEDLTSFGGLPATPAEMKTDEEDPLREDPDKRGKHILGTPESTTAREEEDPDKSDSGVPPSTEDRDGSADLLDEQQMDRLKKLLKKYNLEQDRSSWSSLALLTKGEDD